MFANLPPTKIGDLFKPIVACIKAREPFIVHGDPAIGKSALIRNIADHMKLELIDMRCSGKSNEDFEGLINFNEEKTKATYVPLDTLPLKGEKIPDGKRGWLLFLDEIRQASPEILHALYKVINERQVGDKNELHRRVYIGAASNLASNDNFLTPLPDPMISRLIHFKAVGDFEWWMSGWGKANLVPPLLQYFESPTVNRDYSILNNYAQSEKGDIYASERTWEKFNNICRTMKIKSSDEFQNMPEALLMGTVGNEAGQNLRMWSKSQVSPVSVGDLLSSDTVDVTEFLVFTEEEMQNLHKSMYGFLKTVDTVEDFILYYRRIRNIGNELNTSMMFSNDQVMAILDTLGATEKQKLDIMLKEQKDDVL